MLRSVLDPSLQEGHGGVGECSEKGNEAGEGLGAAEGVQADIL